MQLSELRRLAEPAGVAAYLFAYIWLLRRIHPLAWLPAAIVLLASHWRRGEGPAELGLNGPWKQSAATLGPWVAALVALLVGTASALGTAQRFPPTRMLANFVLYLGWGLVQQYLLNGYFLRRLRAVLSGGAASLAASLLFCAAHAPNPFLMAVTLAGGFASTRIYLRWPNLLLLGLLHGLIGFLLHFAVPDSVARNFLVGPRYFEWRP